MATLKLGPLLRHVGATDATIWVETDRPSEVRVNADQMAATSETFAVAGHHYAIVVVDGLVPGSDVAYEVHLDGVRVWPLDGSTDPPSTIRTVDPSRPINIVFGSCRSPRGVVVRDPTGSGEDVLVGYARAMLGRPSADWPDALLMLGDQVYADETSDATQAYLRARRDTSRPPGLEVADFEEYTHLYQESWGDPAIRWLLSTVPSAMIFDDHDVLDDWNTSRAWRDEMLATDWWAERITGALMSYWIYQHLGNLSPAALATDDLLRRVRSAPDAAAVLRSFAQAADREADGGSGTKWSFRRDYGRVRLIVIDSRAGRVLTEGRRAMIGPAEFAWIEDQLADRDFDHLLVGTSVPWLLPRALHDVESADEAITAGSRGRFLARLGERLRRAVDLEHWAAFRASFDRLTEVFEAVSAVGDNQPPATICVLSGDVHHTYISQARMPGSTPTRVYQITCSPFHNTIPLLMRLVFRSAWTRSVERLTRRATRFARVPALETRWETTVGPFFGNHLGELTLDGRAARFDLHKSERSAEGSFAVTVEEASRRLTPPD